MVDCYRKQDCETAIRGEGACSRRFESDRCPHTMLGENDDDEMQLPSDGAVSDEEPE